MERFVLIYAGVISIVGVVFGVAGWFCMRIARTELERARSILAEAKQLHAEVKESQTCPSVGKTIPFTIADPGKNRRLGFSSGEGDAG